MVNISIVMTAYNSEKYINDAIYSLLNQSFEDFELIVINDGSTDNTKICIENIKDERIRFYDFNKNKGIATALNFGLKIAKGEYIAIADADDLYDKERLKVEKFFLDKNKDIDLVGTYVNYFPNDDTVRDSRRYKAIKNYFEGQLFSIKNAQEVCENLQYFCCIIHSTIMFRRSLLKDYKYTYGFTSSTDYKLFYELNKKGYKMANIDNVLAQIRVTDDSITAETSKSDIDFMFNQLYDIKKEEIEKNFCIDDLVLIWGAGGYGKGFLKEFTKWGFDIYGFLDSDKKKWGGFLGGKEIFNPNILFNRKYKNFKIIVACEPGRIEIVNFIKKLGYRNCKDYIVF